MTRISLELLRKRAEHNNKELFTLEEVSLHQEGIERIEFLDTACKQLKILYLQNNIIGKIENVGRLKSLQYLNLALNNIVVIENVEGLESLVRLDLTVNFIQDVRSVQTLKGLEHFRELYLTGNPCTSIEHYRDYVIATLPQLETLDGQAILRSERIRAQQRYESICKEIDEQLDDLVAPAKYVPHEGPKIEEIDPTTDLDKAQAEFWQEEMEHTPEARYRMQKQQEAFERAEELKKNPPKPVKERKLYRADGTPLNINEGDWEFVLEGQDIYSKDLVLDFTCYKHLDTSQIDLDVQPTHVTIKIKNKVFQLVLPEPVHPDGGKAQRSQITGHLVVTMPKVAKPVPRPSAKKQKDPLEEATTKVEKLEVTGPAGVDYTRIVRDAALKRAAKRDIVPQKPLPRDNDPDFVDDDSVPPLL
eukprot:m.254834 g.254834  ORF g.254834 m.254834 type:complete len:418 (+) comp15495_c0_seq2:175-1428(+)